MNRHYRPQNSNKATDSGKNQFSTKKGDVVNCEEPIDSHVVCCNFKFSSRLLVLTKPYMRTFDSCQSSLSLFRKRGDLPTHHQHKNNTLYLFCVDDVTTITSHDSTPHVFSLGTTSHLLGVEPAHHVDEPVAEPVPSVEELKYDSQTKIRLKYKHTEALTAR
ncbi:hypothetical protein EVAR_8917_1 [Eumeta japonica]|uniref:Uncharacterized protein n=1 Tax=Eumeta variegata TaxID=151549 RepID=A0A4C1U0N3_EUMVA|nr:hypothetical protein EVAR_8917_1 [Eumeta japonica]